MSEIIRETRNAINSRLDMLEVLVTSSRSSYPSYPMSNSNNPCDNHRIDVMNKRITSLETILEHVNDKYHMIESTMYKFNDLLTNIQKKIESIEKQNAPILKVMGDTPKCKDCKELSYDCICDMPPLISVSEMIPEIVIEDDAISQIKKDMNNSEEEYCDTCDATPCNGAHGYSGDAALADMKSRGLEVVDNKVVPIQEEEVVEEEVVEEEEVAEEEEVVEEEEKEEQEQEQEEQEEALELEEFEYKGMTLYRAPDNKVYRMDENNEISEPLGMWDEKSKKIKKIYNL